MFGGLISRASHSAVISFVKQGKAPLRSKTKKQNTHDAAQRFDEPGAGGCKLKTCAWQHRVEQKLRCAGSTIPGAFLDMLWKFLKALIDQGEADNGSRFGKKRRNSLKARKPQR